MAQADDILFETRGALGLITLNRPQALNALTFGMVGKLAAALDGWERNEAVKAVAIRGAGDRAFCAGGDIRHLYDLAKAGRGAEGVAFWREEYALNVRIHEYPKPYVALIDGIVMGGGVGVSILGSHRVASDKISFAMPEVGIGFYPDVGATWFLPRLPRHAGIYLALTGARIGLADATALGLATHHVASANFDALVEDLAKGVNVDAAINSHAGEVGPAPLAERLALIELAFAEASVEEILTALDRVAASGGSDAAFAAATAATIRTKSPTSLKIAFGQMRRGAGLTLREAMRLEFRLASRILDGHDFVEGVRAVVVDKDNQPRWQPATLDGVTTAAVDSYFAPLDTNELAV